MNMYTATQGALVHDSHSLGGKTVHISVMGQQDSTYRCTYPGGAEKQNKRGKEACKHTLDRAPNHAPVRIRHMQEGGQENA